jgi:hypothetical protein
MRRLVLAVAAVALAAAGCGTREGTEPVGEADAFATVTSITRPPAGLIDWMNTVCGVITWLDRPVSEDTVDTYLTTALPELDARLAQLTALPRTNTAGDALAGDLRAALEAARPQLVTLTAGGQAIPDKLTRAAEVATLLDQAGTTEPSLPDLITGDPVLNSAHTMADSCT